MKELEKEFIGGGTVKGFQFRQLHNNGNVYLYEVTTDGGSVHYEVFERKENLGGLKVIAGTEVNFEPKVMYPSDNAFGVWAFTYNTLEMAEEKFIELNSIVMDRINNK